MTQKISDERLVDICRFSDEYLDIDPAVTEIIDSLSTDIRDARAELAKRPDAESLRSLVADWRDRANVHDKRSEREYYHEDGRQTDDCADDLEAILKQLPGPPAELTDTPNEKGA